MSKIGKKPIIIPDGVEIKIDGREIEVKGKSGAVVLPIPSFIKAEIKDKEMTFTPDNNSKQTRANWGTVRSLVNNATIGIMKGFQKNLEIEGVGYRAVMEGDTLVLSLGYSHPVKFPSPPGVKVSVAKNVISIAGINKDDVGRAAAKIRAFKKVEPYKGKGIKYQGEIVRRKVGKKVAGAAK